MAPCLPHRLGVRLCLHVVLLLDLQLLPPSPHVALQLPRPLPLVSSLALDSSPRLPLTPALALAARPLPLYRAAGEGAEVLLFVLTLLRLLN